MSVPDAVARQDEASDAAWNAFEQLTSPDGAPSPSTSTPPTTEAPATPEPPAAGNEVEALRKQLEYERHRNQSLQGRIDSQLRTANAELKELRAQIGEVAARPTGPQVPAHSKHLKPEEVAQQDAASLDLQSRVAKGVAEEEVARMQAELTRQNRELQARLEALEQQRGDAEADTLWDSVEKLAPGAKAINDSDPDWFTFLEGVDAVSGRSRRAIGSAAAAVGDVSRLASLIGEYQATKGAAPAKPAPAQVRPPVRPAPAAPTAPIKPEFRNSQVAAFYEKWRRGDYKGREKEAEELSRQIDDALAEGRIKPG